MFLHIANAHYRAQLEKFYIRKNNKNYLGDNDRLAWYLPIRLFPKYWKKSENSSKSCWSLNKIQHRHIHKDQLIKIFFELFLFLCLIYLLEEIFCLLPLSIRNQILVLPKVLHYIWNEINTLWEACLSQFPKSSFLEIYQSFYSLNYFVYQENWHKCTKIWFIERIWSKTDFGDPSLSHSMFFDNCL